MQSMPGPGPIAALVGPTGVGKSALASALAGYLPVEVVSADSRAVYRWMDIGTAKPSPAERQRVPHHLIDVVDPDEPYSLAQYQQQALAAVARIAARGCKPLLVGGAGLYVSAVCDDLTMPDVAPDVPFRAAMEERARRDGWQALQTDLREVDPESARRIDPKNVRRVIRALEVHHATGKPFSAWQTLNPPVTGPVMIGLHLERAALFARLDRRIDGWIEGGFVEEVRELLARGFAPGLPSMSGIGYREIAQVVRGEVDLQSAVAQFKQATHQYAKRQMTWFRRDKRIVWLDAATATPEQALEMICTPSPFSRAGAEETPSPSGRAGAGETPSPSGRGRG